MPNFRAVQANASPITDSVVAPVRSRGPRGGAHDGMRAIDTSREVTARMMRGRRGKAGVGHSEATTECQAPRGVGERCEVLVAVVNEAGDIFHRRLNEGGVNVLPTCRASGPATDLMRISSSVVSSEIMRRDSRLVVSTADWSLDCASLSGRERRTLSMTA